MPLLLRFWPHLLLAALVALAGAWLYRAGGNAARLDCMQAQAAQEAAHKAAVAAEQQRADEANEALRARLAKPAPGQTIREVVRNVPSDCAIDPDIADSVREAVQRANQAATAQ